MNGLPGAGPWCQSRHNPLLQTQTSEVPKRPKRFPLNIWQSLRAFARYKTAALVFWRPVLVVRPCGVQDRRSCSLAVKQSQLYIGIASSSHGCAPATQGQATRTSSLKKHQTARNDNPCCDYPGMQLLDKNCVFIMRRCKNANEKAYTKFK
jgi:hypothetical protein